MPSLRRSLPLLILLAPSLAGADTAGISAGNAANERGDYAQAISLFNAALQDPKLLREDRATAFNGRGLSYLNQGDSSRAIADFSQALQQIPDYAPALDNRGNAYQARGELERAIADYNRALELDRRFTKAYNNRGSAYYAEGKLDLAIADFSKALTIDHKYTLALSSRGAAYQARGDYDLALADLNQALQNEPNNPFIYNNRGNTYAAKGDYGHAVTDLSQALKLLPAGAKAEQGAILRSRANASRSQAHWSQALADYAEALSLNPHDNEALKGRGLCYLEAGQPRPALADFQQALSQMPAQPYVLLWRYLAQQQLKEGADAALASALGQYGGRDWPYPVLAYYGGGSIDALRQAVGQGGAAGLRGRQCESAAYVGAVQWLRGQREPATKMLREAASICPHNYDEYGLVQALQKQH